MKMMKGNELVIILFFFAVILICLVEGIPLVKKGLWRELGTLGVLIGTAVLLGIVKIMGVSSVGWLQQLLGPVGEAVLK